MSAFASWTCVTVGGIRWRIDPAYEHFLLGPGGLLREPEPATSETGALGLTERIRAGQAVVVKQGYHRTVYRVNLPGLSCYIKHNRITGWRSWGRELLRGCKSVNECSKLLEIAGRGVPTAKPIAVGEAGRRGMPGESYLITEALDDVETLLMVVDKRLPAIRGADAAQVRRSLIQALAELLATLHDAGVRHHDLHAANILVRLVGQRAELFLIDLHLVDLGQPLDWTRSRDNLVLLHGWAVLRIPRAERLRFWKAYWRSRKRLRGPVPAVQVERSHDRIGGSSEASWQMVRVLTGDVEQRTWEFNYRFWKRRDNRCLRSNRYFRRLRSPVAMGHMVSDFDPGVAARLLEDPDAPFRGAGVKLFKDSKTSTVAELKLTVHGVERTLIYKRFRMPDWHAPWTNLVRPAPVLRSWVAGHGLIDRTVPTPRPLLMLQRRTLGSCREGYLLTEKVDAVNLHSVLRTVNGYSALERRRVLRQYVEAVARVIARLHRCGVSHRDLKADNVLVTDPQRGSVVECSLIDLVGVTRPSQLSRRRRVQNLARLNASFHDVDAMSRSDRLRFLLTYLHTRPGGRDNWRSWWKDVARATEEKVAHNRRKGRVVW